MLSASEIRQLYQDYPDQMLATGLFSVHCGMCGAKLPAISSGVTNQFIIFHFSLENFPYLVCCKDCFEQHREKKARLPKVKGVSVSS